MKNTTSVQIGLKMKNQETNVRVLYIGDGLPDGKNIVSVFTDTEGKPHLITHYSDGSFLKDKQSDLDLVINAQ